jgi:tetratricopeptide (TPR) repeat protein
VQRLRYLLPLVLLGACARSSSHAGPVREASSARVLASASAHRDLLRAEPESAAPRGLGAHHRAISSRSPAAQRAFDDGLGLLYTGDPDRAARRFRDAARVDPSSAMGFFGLSLALAEAASAERSSDRAAEARAAADAAARVVAGASPVERALVDALAVRYRDGGGEAAFASALAGVAARFPADLDAKTIYARVAMAIAADRLWPRSGETPKSTLAVVAALEDALARDPDHLGANEAYVRALVGSPHPERALAAADRLARLGPNSPAFAHLAARLYHRVGRHAAAAAADERALALDPAPGSRGAVPPVDARRARHEALLVASCVAAARATRALEVANDLAHEASPEVPESAAVPALVLARFGRYDEVLEQPAPPATSPIAVVLWRFSRGLAEASLGRADAASGELASLAAAGRDVGDEEHDGLVDLAATMLEARIAESRGDRDVARRMLEDAARREDALSYDAALPWLLPARDALGVVLLDDRRPGDAEAVYRRELDRGSESAWTLLGLAESLRAQGRTVDASIAEGRFRRTFAGDAPLRRSRF